jgi:LEA14-like dessication related protein
MDGFGGGDFPINLLPPKKASNFLFLHCNKEQFVPMQANFRGLALAMLVLIVLPACGVRQLAQGEIQPPKVSFQGLSLGQPTSRGWPVSVTLLLTNPNDQALNLKGYDCELWLEGKSVAQAAGEEPVNLPSQGQTVARVPILVKLPAVMGLLPVLLTPEPPPLHYQVAGGFRLGMVLGGLVRVPFRFQGQVTPKEGLESLRPYLK